MASNGNNMLTALGPSTSLVNDQLVASADYGAIMPAAANFVMPGSGASPSLIPGGNLAQDGAAVTSSGATPAADTATIAGIPALVFWILLALAAGYIFIWRVHFA